MDDLVWTLITGKAMQFTQKCFDQYYFIFVNIPQFNWKKKSDPKSQGDKVSPLPPLSKSKAY